MNLDPFGHIAVARHFKNAYKRELSTCKTPECKKIFIDAISEIDERIKIMESWEIKYWNDNGDTSC